MSATLSEQLALCLATPEFRTLTASTQGIVRHRHDHMLGLDYQSVDACGRRWTRLRGRR